MAIQLTRETADLWMAGSSPAMIIFSPSTLAHKHRAGRIACPEAADQPEVAWRHVFGVFVKSDDRPGRRGIGVFIEDDDVLFALGMPAQHAMPDHLIHIDVCLMQPKPLQRVRDNPQV